MRSEKDPARQLDRRSLLKGASLALGAAGVTAASATGAVAAVDESKPQQAGYSETDHVRTYYKHARF